MALQCDHKVLSHSEENWRLLIPPNISRKPEEIVIPPNCDRKLTIYMASLGSDAVVVYVILTLLILNGKTEGLLIPQTMVQKRSLSDDIERSRVLT